MPSVPTVWVYGSQCCWAGQSGPGESGSAPGQQSQGRQHQARRERAHEIREMIGDVNFECPRSGGG